jgi:hypothetical protein
MKAEIKKMIGILASLIWYYLPQKHDIAIELLLITRPGRLIARS